MFSSQSHLIITFSNGTELHRAAKAIVLHQTGEWLGEIGGCFGTILSSGLCSYAKNVVEKLPHI